MTEFAKQVFEVISPVLLSAIGVMVSFLVNEAIAYLKRQSAGLQAQNYRAAADRAIYYAERITQSVVMSLEQTVAEELRQRIKNDPYSGGVTSADLQAVGVRAVEDIKKLLGDEVLNALSEVVTDIDGYLKNEVEKQVYKLKNLKG